MDIFGNPIEGQALSNGGVIDGDLEITGNGQIDGDLNVNGTITAHTIITEEELEVKDPLITLGVGAPDDTRNLGLLQEYNDGSLKYAGVVRSKDDKKQYLLEGVTPRPLPGTNITNLARGDLVMKDLTSDTVTSGIVSCSATRCVNLELRDVDQITQWFVFPDDATKDLKVFNRTSDQIVNVTQAGLAEFKTVEALNTFKLTGTQAVWDVGHDGRYITFTCDDDETQARWRLGTYQFRTYDSGTSGGSMLLERGRGSVSAPEPLQPGDNTFTVSFIGASSNGTNTAGSISCTAVDDYSIPGGRGSDMIFRTVTLSSTVTEQRLKLDSSGITMGADITGYKLPVIRGTANQILKTDANGIVTWQDESGGGGETLQNVYDNSLTPPQIITSVDEGAIEIQQGVGASNDLIRIRDSAGTDRGSISSDGIYTDFGLYIGGISSYNITKEVGNIFQITEAGDQPFLEYAPQNLFLGRGGLSNTSVRGGSFVVDTLSQTNNLATNGTEGVQQIYRRSRGTDAVPIALVAGDEVSDISYRGYDGSAFQEGCLMKTKAPTSWGPSTRECQFEFYTTPVNTITGAELALTIKGNGQLLAQNQTAAAPTYSFATNPDTGMYKTGASNVGIAAAGSRILEVAFDGCIVESAKYLKLNSTAQDATTANPVTMTFISNGNYISGLVMKIVDVGGAPRVQPIAFNDPDSTAVIGVSTTAPGIAGQSVEVAIGGTFLATVANGATVNIGDLCEKSDTNGQDGRIVATAPSVGSVLVALGSGTGDAAGTVKVLCMFKKNESF